MSGKAKTSGASHSAVGDDHDQNRGDSEPKTKKQRLLPAAAASDQNAETEEELYQKAVALVFGGELYAKLLRYAGPEGIATLRGDRKLRKAMDDLPADDIRALKLPVVERPDDVDLYLLRQMLTETAPAALIGQASGCWTLNELGWNILVRSPLTSNAVISDVINSGNGNLLDSISLRPGNSTKVLADLVRIEKPELLWRISSRPAATSEVLSAILVRLLHLGSKLAGSNVTSTLESIARHYNTGELDLDFLSAHEDSWFRRCVAENRSTPCYLLRKLSLDAETYVRAAVASNPQTPRDTLISLSVDASERIRAGVARNPNAGLDLLTKLALDDDFDVLYDLAQSHKNYFDLIFDEARKSHRSIIASYSANSDALAQLVGNDDECYDSLVADNSNTSQELLARLATSDDERVRMGVAGNKNASSATLEFLLNDDACKKQIASNESTPIQILEALAKDDDIRIVKRVAQNESATPEILRGIISSDPPDSVPYAVFDNESLSIADVVDFAASVIERDIKLQDNVEDSLFGRLEDESDDLPVSLVVAMSKNDNLHFQRIAATCSNLPVKEMIRLSKIEDIHESLEINTLLQVAVDKLYHLLSSGGVGSGVHFTDGENWW